MTAALAGVLVRTGVPEERDRESLRAALGPDARVHRSGPLAVAWTAGEAVIGQRLCVLAGRRYAGPEPRAMAGAAAPPASLRGDFALLSWDGLGGFLARDQMGQHGVVYHDDGTRLRFACEVITLLAMLPRTPAPDARAMAHWLAVSGQPGRLTLYEGISRLGAGELLPLDAERARPPRRWWSPRPGDVRAGSRQDHAAALRAALEIAVDRRTGTGADTAVQLSGGLDSTAVAGLAADLPEGRRPRRAYSATFPEHPSVDETVLIDRTCAELGLSSTKAVVRSGSVLTGAVPYMERWGLPPVSPNLFFWSAMLRQAAADGTTVLLDGEGGDELFGLSPYLVADELALGRVRSAAALAARVPGTGDAPPPGFVRDFLRRFGVMGLAPAGLHSVSRRVRPAARYVPGYLHAHAARAFVEVADGAAWKRGSGPRWWRWMMWAVSSGMGPALAYDHVRHRAAMAGIEPRHPLVDVDVVELVLSLPPQLAFDAHLTRPLLRDAVAGLIPEEVRMRPGKSTFDAVFHDALEGSDRRIAAALLGADARVGAYVDLNAARAQLLEAAPPASGRGRMEWAIRLWRLLTAECWLLSQEHPDALRAAVRRADLPDAMVAMEPAPGSGAVRS